MQINRLSTNSRALWLAATRSGAGFAERTIALPFGSRLTGYSRPNSPHTGGAIFPLIAILLFASFVLAQPAPPSENTQQVYVHDSTDVAYKLAQADHMAHLRQWDTAIANLQDIIDHESDRVVSTEPNDQTPIVHYTSAGSVAQARLITWPPEGIAAYRARFDSAASTALKSAENNPAQLQHILDRYFICPSAKTAALTLIDLSFNAGNFADAFNIAHHFLQDYPQLGPDRPAFLFRVALAAHLLHDDSESHAALAELQSKFPAARSTVNGQSVLLATALVDLLKSPIPTDQRSSDYWPTWGGNNSRDRFITTNMKLVGLPLLTVSLSKPGEAFNGIPNDAALQAQEDRNSGIWLNVWPVVDGDTLYFQDSSRIAARSIETGLPPHGWNDYSTGPASAPAGVALTITLTDDSIFAVTGQGHGRDEAAVRMLMPFGGPSTNIPAQTRLVCLDRITGSPRWITESADLPEKGSLRSLHLSSCPLVTCSSVFVLARGGRAGQFNDCYLLSFDLKTGKLNWASYIASATLNNYGFGGSAGAINDLSHLSASGSQIFVQTNVGAVAAVDAYSGNIAWLDVYSRQAAPTMMSRRFGTIMYAQAKPWTFNAPLVTDGKLFVLPSDSENLLILDALTGKEIQHIALADFDQPDTLLAADDNRLLFSSDEKLWCIDWPKYDPTLHASDETQGVFWEQDFHESPIQGRAFATSQIVYVPTKRLYRIDMRTGKIIDVVPGLSQPLPQNGPGNILATAEKLILTSSAHIDVFANPAAAIAQLESEEKLHPDNGDALLRHAALLFAAGDSPAALAKLDQEQSLADPRHPELRQRTFDLLMQWIEHLNSEQTPAASQEITQLFAHADQMIDSPKQKARYCLARAALAESENDWATAVQSEQEILQDEPARSVPIVQPDGRTLTAGLLAEKAIASIQSGPGAPFYQPIEAQAQAAFKKAQSDADPAELFEVAQQFPNAAITNEALRASTQQFMLHGHAGQAAVALHELFMRKGGDTGDIPQAIAQAILSDTGNLAVAAAWLERAGNQKLQSPLRLLDGRMIAGVTAAQAAEQLENQQQRQDDDVRPEFHWDPAAGPFTPDAPTIKDVSALLTPLDAAIPSDQIITWSHEKGLSLHSSDIAGPIGSNSEISTHPLSVQFAQDHIIVSESQFITVVQANNAHAIWRVSLAALPPILAIAAPENEQKLTNSSDMPLDIPMQIAPNMMVARGGVVVFGQGVPPSAPPPPAPALAPEITVARIAARRVICATSDGRLFALNLADGSLAWNLRISDTPITRLQTNSFFAVAATQQERRNVLIAVDISSGRVVRSVLAGPQPIDFALSLDDRLVTEVQQQTYRVELDSPISTDVSSAMPQLQPSPFMGIGSPAQLLLTHGRIFSVVNSAVVRCEFLSDSQPTPALLGTGAALNSPINLTAAWPELYITGSNTLMACDVLQNQGGLWTVPAEVQIADLLIGRNKLLVRDKGGGILIYSREMTPHGESGRLEFDNTTQHPVHITAWQLTSDGFCYLTGHDLHIVRGE